MELEHAIHYRRSVRSFQDRDLPEEEVLELLRLSSWAPSASNRQMWFFTAVHAQTVREQVAQAIEKKLEEIARWPESAGAEEAFRFPARYPCFIRQAPWLVAFSLEETTSPFESLLRRHGLSGELIARWRPLAGLQSISAAIQNFLLAAHGRGLGSVWMVGPLFAVEEIEELLEIHAPRRLIALLPLGYPAEDPAPPPRKAEGETWRIIR
jgi:nitroreductase